MKENNFSVLFKENPPKTYFGYYFAHLVEYGVFLSLIISFCVLIKIATSFLYSISMCLYLFINPLEVDVKDIIEGFVFPLLMIIYLFIYSLYQCIKKVFKKLNKPVIYKPEGK